MQREEWTVGDVDSGRSGQREERTTGGGQREEWTTGGMDIGRSFDKREE